MATNHYNAFLFIKQKNKFSHKLVITRPVYVVVKTIIQNCHIFLIPLGYFVFPGGFQNFGNFAVSVTS